jgi:rRNA-processing protein EBP2
MAKKSKLLAALDAHKGRDFEAEKRKKQVKSAEKRKRQKLEVLQKSGGVGSDQEDVETSVALESAVAKPADNEFASFSDSPDEDNADDEVRSQNGDSSILQPHIPASASASVADPESDVPLSDLSEDDREDIIPHQRLTINNGPALLASCKRITVVRPKMPFHLHNSLVSTLPAASASIPDPNDDLTRELEFYRIARTAALEARTLLKKEKIPFSRPTDYFAEMVKSDEHMGRVKKKMYDEAAAKKAASEARTMRDAKKFGKAVQVAKEQERAKEKRNTLDKIKDLKRSKHARPTRAPFVLLTLDSTERKGQDTGKVNEDDDLFDHIDVEDGPKKDGQGRERGGRPSGLKRQKRDEKFGFGGKKRFSKSGDAASSGDMRGFSAGRMKGKGRGGSGAGSGSKRLGKSRRNAGAR